MQGFYLGYLFASFAVGLACLGVALQLAARRRDALSRTFLATYAALSVLVTASLALAFMDAAPGVIPESARGFLVYLESIVGFYGVLLTVPLLAHRVFGVDDPRRDRIVVAAVLATLGLQHVTEFALGSTPWDERGDRLEDGVLIALLAYSLWVAGSRLARTAGPLARRVFALLLLGGPVALYDLFLGEAWGVRAYPLGYCAASLIVTWTLVRDTPEPAGALRVAEGWGLSERELEVADQVALGRSNKEVAAALHISTNTVKTHLRKVFEKAGVQSRFELMARMDGRRRDHPRG